MLAQPPDLLITEGQLRVRKWSPLNSANQLDQQQTRVELGISRVDLGCLTSVLEEDSQQTAVNLVFSRVVLTLKSYRHWRFRGHLGPHHACTNLANINNQSFRSQMEVVYIWSRCRGFASFGYVVCPASLQFY